MGKTFLVVMLLRCQILTLLRPARTATKATTMVGIFIKPPERAYSSTIHNFTTLQAFRIASCVTARTHPLSQQPWVA